MATPTETSNECLKAGATALSTNVVHTAPVFVTNHQVGNKLLHQYWCAACGLFFGTTERPSQLYSIDIANLAVNDARRRAAGR